MIITIAITIIIIVVIQKNIFHHDHHPEQPLTSATTQWRGVI